MDIERLPFHRLLNVTYTYIKSRLPVGEVEDSGAKRNYRQELDDMLRTHQWPVPRTFFGTQRHVELARSNVPSWWRGDEEASQSFLGAMGVRL